MSYRSRLLRGLTVALGRGTWSAADATERLTDATNGGEWIPSLVTRLFEAYPTQPAPDALFSFLRQDEPFRKLTSRQPELVRLRHWSLESPQFGERRWEVPPLATVGELSSWLGVSISELQWLSDSAGLERFAEHAARNYDYRWKAKRSGGSRLIESPKPLLRGLQRRLLTGLLNAIPPHPAAQGFRRDHSVRSHAALHVGSRLLLKFDLTDFFSSVRARRITGLFRTAGYPDEVARVLTAICTNRVPQAVLRAQAPSTSPRAREAQRWRDSRLSLPHLPQGAPTSPALANLAAYRLDQRLSALATSWRGRYSRYADDLAFSFDAIPVQQDFAELVAEIALDEGFLINHRKTRAAPSSVRQRVTGIVVNVRPNIARSEYDTLKAILHNCRQHGPESQRRGYVGDFRAHLRGRIEWVTSLNPARGAKLRAIYDAVDWAVAASPSTVSLR